MTKPEYLIPRAVTARFEFFPGWGVPEVVAVVVGAAAGGLLQAGVAHLPLLHTMLFGARLGVFILPAACAYMLVRKDIGGHSALDQLRAARAYGRKQHRYLYRRIRPFV